MAIEQRRVFAVPGRLLPSMTRHKHFVGYELLTDASVPADFEVPQGSRYRVKPDGEFVRWDSYHRCATRDGDISETAPAAPAPLVDAQAALDAAHGAEIARAHAKTTKKAEV